MTISKRVLNAWRREALIEVDNLREWNSDNEATTLRREYSKIILKLTQELLDLQVIQEHKEKESKYVS